MPKKKYITDIKQTPSSYECANRKCKWQGTDEEKERVKTPRKAEYVVVCPNCGKDVFYGLI